MREKETMAKKSKTQRAKASAARQARKVQAAELEAKGISAEEVEAQKKAEAAKQEKKAVEKAKPKKLRSELKRVTWPTRNEVLRWTGVVVGALLFFGIFVAVLDNLIVTPIVVGISSIGAGV